MKRKIDQNRPTSKGVIPWRLMLGGALLCFLTSLNSFGQQTAAQLLADYQAAKSPYVSIMSPNEKSVYLTMVHDLTLKMNAEEAAATAAQIQSTQAQIDAINAQLNAVPHILTKPEIVALYAQLGILGGQLNALNGTSPPVATPVIPFGEHPPVAEGVHSFDPTKPGIH